MISQKSAFHTSGFMKFMKDMYEMMMMADKYRRMPNTGYLFLQSVFKSLYTSSKTSCMNAKL